MVAVAALAAVGAWAFLGLGGSGQPPRPGPAGWPAGVGGLAGISRIVVPTGLRLAKPRPRPQPAVEEPAGHPQRDPGSGKAESLEPPARDEPASSAEPQADEREPERGDRPDFWFDRDGDGGGGGSAPPEEMNENDRRSPQQRFIDGLEGNAGCEVSTEALFLAWMC